jgi:hypothetical protein
MNNEKTEQENTWNTSHSVRSVRENRKRDLSIVDTFINGRTKLTRKFQSKGAVWSAEAWMASSKHKQGIAVEEGVIEFQRE